MKRSRETYNPAPPATCRCGSEALRNGDDCVRCGRQLVKRERSTDLTAPDWTRLRVVLAIKVFAKTHGRPPRKIDWPCATTLNPSANTVVRLFGTWKHAIRAAGFTPDARGRKPKAAA